MQYSFVFLVICACITPILRISGETHANSSKESKNVPNNPQIQPVKLDPNRQGSNSTSKMNGNNSSKSNNKSVETKNQDVISSKNDSSNLKVDDEENHDTESNFLRTVMMVLLSVSMLFITFVAYKTYRRRSRSARIKKYGVRLHRGNIEMTPLPLDNDDEDETVFDLKNLPT